MNRNRALLTLGSFLHILVLAIVFAGCSKDEKTTNPGGGGSTLSLDLPANGSNSFTFATAGVFPYRCSIHPLMTNDTVFVEAGAPVSDVTVAVVSTGTPGFNPQSVHIQPGGTVHWTNSTTGVRHIVVNR